MTVTLAETPLPSVVDTTTICASPAPSLPHPGIDYRQPQPPTANDPGATDN
jgi:hypothetical protein